MNSPLSDNGLWTRGLPPRPDARARPVRLPHAVGPTGSPFPDSPSAPGSVDVLREVISQLTAPDHECHRPAPIPSRGVAIP
ncbi:hypothetical protein GCM10010279_60250 [Streptomyces mutabilis]|nr:hypothetical protein GCM10010279_60250 [Streptomyces mutabilis]